MNGIKRRLIAGLSALAIAATSGVPAVFAEGSKDLVEIPHGINSNDTAYRPYLEWRNRPQLGSEGTGVGATRALESKSVVYVYANEGETVYFGTSNRKSNAKSIASVVAEGAPSEEQVDAIDNSLLDSTIAVTMPASKEAAYDPTVGGATFVEATEQNIAAVTDFGNTNIFLFKPENVKGYIANTAQEEKGPSTLTSGGYEPLSFVAPVTGTYSFRFLAPDYENSERPTQETVTELEKLQKNTLVYFTDKPESRHRKNLYSRDRNAVYIAKASEDATSAVEPQSNLKNNDIFYGLAIDGTTKGLHILSAGKVTSSSKENSIEVIPAESGRIFIAAASASSKPGVNVVQNGNTIGTLNLEYSSANSHVFTKGFDVEADEPVYIYTGGSVFIYGIYLTDSTYDVSITTDGNGTVTADKTKDITAGDIVTLEVTPNEGYELESLTVNSGAVELSKKDDAGYTFAMPSGNAAVSAAFRSTAPVPQQMPLGIYTPSGDTTENNTTIHLIGDYILANGTSNKPVWATTSANAYVYDADLRNNVIYIQGTSTSAAEGNIEVIPAVSGVFTVFFARRDDGTMQRNLKVVQDSAELASVTDMANTNTDGTVSAVSVNVEAGKPIYVFGGGLYIYALQLSEQLYNITTSTDGHGTITPNKTAAAKNEPVVFTVMPDSNYEIGSVKLNGVEIELVNGSRSFYMPEGNAEINAAFTASSAAPERETAYAEWVFSDEKTTLPSAVFSPSGAQIEATLSTSDTSTNGLGTAETTPAESISYAAFTGTKEYTSPNKIYGLKIGSGTTVEVDPNLSAGYESCTVRIVYADLKNQNEVKVKASYKQSGQDTTKVGDNPGTNKVSIIDIDLTENTNIKIQKESGESHLLYVGIKYDPIGTSTQSVAGAKLMSKIRATEFAAMGNEISGVSELSAAQTAETLREYADYTDPAKYADGATDGWTTTSYNGSEPRKKEIIAGSGLKFIAGYTNSRSRQFESQKVFTYPYKGDVSIVENINMDNLTGGNTYGYFAVLAETGNSSQTQYIIKIGVDGQTGDVYVDDKKVSTWIANSNNNENQVRNKLLKIEVNYNTKTGIGSYTLIPNDNESIKLTGDISSAAQSIKGLAVGNNANNGATEVIPTDEGGNGTDKRSAFGFTIKDYSVYQEPIADYTVRYIAGDGTELRSIDYVPSEVVGEEATYYWPAYVLYNGTYYRANTNGIYGKTITLGQSNNETVEYVPDADVIGFAEAEDMSNNGGSEYTIIENKPGYSMGKLKYIDNPSGSRSFYTDFTVTDTGMYELSGPMLGKKVGTHDYERTAVFSFANCSGKLALKDNVPGNISLVQYMTPGTYRFTYSTDGRAPAPALDYAVLKKSSATAYSVAANAENGTISADTAFAAAGQTVYITATPDKRYELDTVSYTPENGGATAVLPDAKGVYSFTMPAANVTVSASFKMVENPQYDITAGSHDGGTLSVDKTTVSAGETITVTAMPDIDHLGGTVSVTTASGVQVPVTNNTFTMPSDDVTVTAIFEARPRTLHELPRRDGSKTNDDYRYEAQQAAEGLTDGVYNNDNGTIIGDYAAVYADAGNTVTVTGGNSIAISSSSTSAGVIKLVPEDAGVLTVDYSGEIRIAQGKDGSIPMDTAISSNVICSGSGSGRAVVSVTNHTPVYIFSGGGALTVTKIYNEEWEDAVGKEWRIDSPCLVGAWDITVAKDGAAQSGRVWTEIFFMNAKAHKRSIYPQMYILTRDGFEYQFDFNGMQPYSFLFYSNSRGFLKHSVGEDGTDSIQSLYHSFYSRGTNSDVGVMPEKTKNGVKVAEVYSNFRPFNPTVDVTHRIFFNRVENDSDALKVYTERQGFATGDSTVAFNQLSPVFTGYGGNAYEPAAGYIDQTTHKATIGYGGKFTFTIKKITDNSATHIDPSDKSVLWMTDADMELIKGKSFALTLDYTSYRLNANNEPITTNVTYYSNKDGSTLQDADGDPLQVAVWNKRAEGEQPNDNELANTVILTADIDGFREYNMIWDGKDVYGNNVPVTVEVGPDGGGFAVNGSGYYTAKTAESQGEAHMPMADVERLPYGVKVERLNTYGNKEQDEKDPYRLYYNNQAIPPNPTAEPADDNGTADTASLMAESGSEAVNFNYSLDDTTWYFTGKTKSLYPKMIGDGRNGMAGVDTDVTPGMVVGNYPTVVDANGKTVGDKDAEPAWSNETGDLSINEAGYGNYAALDMWARYIAVAGTELNYGVNPEADTRVGYPYVSYVMEDKDEETAQVSNDESVRERFKVSHVMNVAKQVTEYPENHGLPTDELYDRYKEEAQAVNTGVRSFGHTISTGYIISFNSNDGTSYNAVAWKVTVDASDDQTFVKTDQPSDESNQWNQVISSDTPVFKDTETTQGTSLADKAGENGALSLVNGGSIYKVDPAKKFELDFKADLPNISNAGEVVLGIVLDNIYAPKSKAEATYYTKPEAGQPDPYADYFEITASNAVADQTDPDRFMNAENNPYKYGVGVSGWMSAADQARESGFDSMVDFFGNPYDEVLNGMEDIASSDMAATRESGDDIVISGDDTEAESISDAAVLND